MSFADCIDAYPTGTGPYWADIAFNNVIANGLLSSKNVIARDQIFATTVNAVNVIASEGVFCDYIVINGVTGNIGHTGATGARGPTGPAIVGTTGPTGAIPYYNETNFNMGWTGCLSDGTTGVTGNILMSRVGNIVNMTFGITGDTINPNTLPVLSATTIPAEYLPLSTKDFIVSVTASPGFTPAGILELVMPGGIINIWSDTSYDGFGSGNTGVGINNMCSLTYNANC